jgi:hypothetical protein
VRHDGTAHESDDACRDRSERASERAPGGAPATPGVTCGRGTKRALGSLATSLDVGNRTSAHMSRSFSCRWSVPPGALSTRGARPRRPRAAARTALSVGHPSKESAPAPMARALSAATALSAAHSCGCLIIMMRLPCSPYSMRVVAHTPTGSGDT